MVKETASSGVTGVTTPRISVAIFTYNFEAFISDCLDSMLNQTLRPYEVIVCDDCSTDNTWQIIQQYKQRYPDFFVTHRHEKNVGHLANGAFGKDLIRGNLCCLMDGDDRWLPTKLEREWDALKNNPEAKVAFSGVLLTNAKNEQIGAWVPENNAHPPSGDILIPVIAKRFYSNTRSLLRNHLIYTDVLRTVGYKEHDANLIHADWDLTINLSAKYKIVYSGDYLVEYRQHGTSIHRKRNNDLYDSARLVINKNLFLLRGRTEKEIDFALEGINSLLAKLAGPINKTPVQLKRSDIYPPRVIINSLPKSGTNLVVKLMSMLPGLKMAGIHLGNSSQATVPEDDETTIPIGVDMPKKVPFEFVKKNISQLGGGEFLSGHIPYSRTLDQYLQHNQIKIVLMMRDPRAVVASHAAYIADSKQHPLHALYKNLNQDGQRTASIRGGSYNGNKLLSLLDRFQSVMKWDSSPNVHLMHFEDIVGEKGGGSSMRQMKAISQLAAFLNIRLTASENEQVGRHLFGETKTFRKGQINAWQTDLEQHHIEEIQLLLGEQMTALGYAPVDTTEVHNTTVQLPAQQMKEEGLGERLIYLVSQPRSGSTLLQRVLGANDAVHTVAEPWLMLHPLYSIRKEGIYTEYGAQYAREGVDDFIATLPGGMDDYIEGIRIMASHWYGKALENSGKTIFLDKTPRYYNIIPDLNKVFPKSNIILLFRNPLSVLSSVLKTWVGRNWSRLQLHREDILRAPFLMVHAMETLKDRVIIFRYEEFINAPESELNILCEKLSLHYAPDMLNYGLKQAPSGKMGDNVGISKYQKPEKESLEKWKTTFADPLYHLLAEIVLELLGEEVITKMGYSYDELKLGLNTIHVNKQSVPHQELVAMIAALQLKEADVTRIGYLIEPYLSGQARNVNAVSQPELIATI